MGSPGDGLQHQGLGQQLAKTAMSPGAMNLWAEGQVCTRALWCTAWPLPWGHVVQLGRKQVPCTLHTRPGGGRHKRVAMGTSGACGAAAALSWVGRLPEDSDL